MKIKNTSVSLATVVLVFASGLPLTAIAGHTYQTANVVEFDSGNPVAGAATLTRTLESATARLYTTGLQKKAAYTIWWVVWNDPSLCTGGCGEDDLGIADNSVFYAGGFVTGTDGTVNVSVHVDAGDLAPEIDVLLPGGLEVGHGFLAEIHLIIRSHGKIIKGLADVQIGSFFGACDINTCFDDQAVAFLP
jgi:hypothetical protein